MLEFGTRDPHTSYIERPGAYAIIRNTAGAFAIIRTTKGYFLPGGGVDSGEDMEAALRREVLEETGLGVTISRKIGEAAQYLTSAREGIFYKKVGHFYLAEFAERVSDTFEAEHELLWMPFDQASTTLNHRFQVWALEQARSL